MLCLELMTGQPPFHYIPADITVAIELANRQLPRRPIACKPLTDELWALLQMCWNKNPHERPSMNQLKLDIKKIRGYLEVSPYICMLDFWFW